MPVSVRLSEALVENAKLYGTIEHRSLSKQIEYCSKIGKVAADNQICHSTSFVRSSLQIEKKRFLNIGLDDALTA